MPRVVKRGAGERDLDEIAAYLQRERPTTALRFLEAANQACERLAEMPLLGGECESDHPALAGLRIWPIRGFRKYLIMYSLHVPRDSENERGFSSDQRAMLCGIL